MVEETTPERSSAGSPPEEPRPGDHIAGRYQVVRLLGRGAGGVVYHVLDLGSETELAVKLLAGPVGQLERLRREVRLAWRITHRNVCRVFDLVEHRGGALLSMQYAPGGTLAARLGRPHDDPELRRIAGAILDGLEAAHAARVVHRDLKPANVLVDADGDLLIADFGIAKALDAVTETGGAGLEGTIAYMAPEQLQGEPVDERTDLYALGLILWELAEGRLPFAAAGEPITLATALRRVTHDVPPIRAGSLRDGIAELTRRDPARRPRDVEEARAALGLVPGLPRRRRGRARGAAAIALGGVGVAATAGAALLLAARADDPSGGPCTIEFTGQAAAHEDTVVRAPGYAVECDATLFPTVTRADTRLGEDPDRERFRVVNATQGARWAGVDTLVAMHPRDVVRLTYDHEGVTSFDLVEVCIPAGAPTLNFGLMWADGAIGVYNALGPGCHDLSDSTDVTRATIEGDGTGIPVVDQITIVGHRGAGPPS